MMRRMISTLTAAVLLTIGITACGSSAGAATAQDSTAAQTAQTQEAVSDNNGSETADAPEADAKEAETAAEETGAATEEVQGSAEATGSEQTKEQDDKSVRPEIGSDPVTLDGYTTIYIGFPIWWGEEPRIMDTFVESYSFDGITMIPFCTSSSSGIGRSGTNLAENAGSGNWLDGQRFGAGASESEIQSWIDGLQ